MPFFAEKESKIFGDILSNITQNTPITRVSPGSKTRAIAEALSKKLGFMYARFDLNVANAFLPTAEGEFLDMLGELLNVTRLGEQRAVVSLQDRNVKFYVDVGTFGSINNGASITIPAGTLISTQPNKAGIVYRVTLDTVLDSAASEGFVACEALVTGSGANLGAHTLIYHDFTGYADSVNNTLKVTNEIDIVSGGDIEPDENFRYRIANQILSVESANLTAVRLEGLNVPGVADIKVIPYARGIGTFDVIVQAVTPHTPDSLISAVDTAIRQKTALGENALVTRPYETGISVTGRIFLQKKLSADEEQNVINAAVSNLRNYIDSLDLGQPFIVNEAVERVMASSQLIKDIGSPNKPFDNIFIYKESRLRDNKIRAKLLGNYQPSENEKVLVEPTAAGNTPILFTIA